MDSSQHRDLPEGHAMTATRTTKPAPAVETPAAEEAPAARKTAHSDCTHEVTPAARAKCRAERAKAVETA
jgi:hypothetical protein